MSYLVSFGGVKASGIGRRNSGSAIYKYLEAKSVFVDQTLTAETPFVFR